MASGDMTVVQYCDNKRGTRGTISFQAHSSSAGNCNALTGRKTTGTSELYSLKLADSNTALVRVFLLEMLPSACHVM